MRRPVGLMGIGNFYCAEENVVGLNYSRRLYKCCQTAVRMATSVSVPCFIGNSYLCIMKRQIMGLQQR